ncbi:MAG TPA: GNAT family N-acetyltransferase [Oceanobacillus sp.]|nr:GNAT family N-acetyltransferase [Oceanobacillus sp.]
MLSTSQCIADRAFQSDEDFWLVRNLLIETYPITPVGFNWEIRRWDGWRYRHENPYWNPEWERCIRLWENEIGELVGVVHPDSAGEAVLEVHPDYRHLEEEMLVWAEEHLAAEDGDRRQLDIFVFEYDTQRRRLLEQRGYERTPYSGVTRRLRFGNKALPDVCLPVGYILRTTRPHSEADYQRVADILNAVFNRTYHTAKELGTFATLAPSFRHDLNLVAEAPDGSFAALVGITYDEVNRRGLFEPVCTHPDHRRRGLARALIYEGLHRLKALGATDVYVDTGDTVPANELYDAVGFTEAYTGYIWRKVF